jgi:hypothetical protein
MPTAFSRVFIAALLAGSLHASAQAPASFEPMALREDLQIARQALEEGHSGIYRYTEKAILDRRFDEAMRALDRPMDALAFYRVLMPTVAAIRCGHTTPLLPLDAKADLLKTLLLPMDVKVLEGKVFIYRDFAQQGALAGREIRTINGLSITRLLAVCLAAAPGDGDVPTGRAHWVSQRFKELLFTLKGMQGSFELELLDPHTRHRTTAKVLGRSLADLRQASERAFPQDQHSKRFAEWSFLDEGRIARLKVFNFIDQEEDEDGASLLKKAFEAIQAKGSKTLILDLRDNPGGEDDLGKRLFSHLVDKPFSYYDDLVLNRTSFTFAKYAEGLAPFPESAVKARPDGRFSLLDHPNVGLQEPSQPIFQGRVLILINGGCFSTTSEFLTAAHDHGRATFIGEESGGGYYGNTSGAQAVLTLPHTKVRLIVPLMTYYLSAKDAHAAARGVLPDHPVHPTIDEQLAGKDSAWELALALARKP